LLHLHTLMLSFPYPFSTIKQFDLNIPSLAFLVHNLAKL